MSLALHVETDSNMIHRPYVESMIYSLDVGPLATRFLIHSQMLSRCSIDPPLGSFEGINDQPIALPELDEGTAHTLVHYLYSGNYQVPSISFKTKPAMHYESYKHATCVYCAAVRYKVPGLARLAKQKMMHHDIDLPIFDVLAVARDHGFPLLPESDTQYAEYLERSITAAMKEDPEPFRKPEFITRFGGNSRLLQVIWKTVISSLSQSPLAASSTDRAADSGAQTPTAESSFAESEANGEHAHQLPSPTESVVDSPPLAYADTIEPPALTVLDAEPEALGPAEEAPPQSDTASNDDFELPAIESTVEEPGVVEAVFKNESKKGHARTDSVIEEDPAAHADGDKAVPVASHGAPEVWKKDKRRAKKKRSSIVF